jgi:hypothetical protein
VDSFLIGDPSFHNQGKNASQFFGKGSPMNAFLVR